MSDINSSLKKLDIASLQDRGHNESDAQLFVGIWLTDRYVSPVCSDVAKIVWGLAGKSGPPTRAGLDIILSVLLTLEIQGLYVRLDIHVNNC